MKHHRRRTLWWRLWRAIRHGRVSRRATRFEISHVAEWLEQPTDPTRWRIANEAERALDAALRRRGFRPGSQHYVSLTFPFPKHVLIDLALEGWGGRLAIEVDGHEHRSGHKRRDDALRDAGLRRRRWSVVRIAREDVLADPDNAAATVEEEIARLTDRARNRRQKVPPLKGTWGGIDWTGVVLPDSGAIHPSWRFPFRPQPRPQHLRGPGAK